jgi:SAM-dependent methyltransferase
VAAELADLNAGRALDLAAGEGRNAIWLAGLGWHVVAVDFSPVGLDKGAQLAASFEDGRAERLAWHTADLLKYEPEPGAFDLVLVSYLQVIASERRQVLRMAAQGLASGGTLLVVAHDIRNLTEGTGGPQDPSVLYSPADVVADLAVSGVTIRVEKAESALRPVDGADRPAIDVLVRARSLGE